MALSTDLIGITDELRIEADTLRKRVAAHPGEGEAMKMLDEIMLRRAARFDRAADFITGMQGLDESELAGVMDMLRTGFKRMSRSYDLSKTYVLAVEAGAAETETGEVAV